MSTQITAERLRSIRPSLVRKIRAAHPEIEAIYMFGSAIDSRVSTPNDLDVALLLPPRDAYMIKPTQWWALQVDLATQADCPVDLVNMRMVSTVFQVQIFSTGQRIYCRHLPTCNEYEGLTLSLYQKLNEERKDILESMRATGIIYG